MKYIKSFNESNYTERFPKECEQFIESVKSMKSFSEYLIEIDKFRKNYIMNNGIGELYDIVTWIANSIPIRPIQYSRPRFSVSIKMVEGIKDWCEYVIENQSSIRIALDEYFRDDKRPEWKTDMMRRLIRSLQQVADSSRHDKVNEIQDIVEFDMIEDSPFPMERTDYSIGYLFKTVYMDDDNPFDSFYVDSETYAMSPRYYYELKLHKSTLNEFSVEDIRNYVLGFTDRFSDIGIEFDGSPTFNHQEKFVYVRFFLIEV